MRINWVAAAPWLCTFVLFALWEGAVWLLGIEAHCDQLMVVSAVVNHP